MTNFEIKSIISKVWAKEKFAWKNFILENLKLLFTIQDNIRILLDRSTRFVLYLRATCSSSQIKQNNWANSNDTKVMATRMQLRKKSRKWQIYVSRIFLHITLVFDKLY